MSRNQTPEFLAQAFRIHLLIIINIRINRSLLLGVLLTMPCCLFSCSRTWYGMIRPCQLDCVPCSLIVVGSPTTIDCVDRSATYFHSEEWRTATQKTVIINVPSRKGREKNIIGWKASLQPDNCFHFIFPIHSEIIRKFQENTHQFEKRTHANRHKAMCRGIHSQYHHFRLKMLICMLVVNSLWLCCDNLPE